MVSATHEPDEAISQFVLCPNRSLTWTQAKLCFAGIAAVSLAVAIGFALLGLWPILPFAGLELAGLAYCFYACAWRAEHREVVTIGRDSVQVESGRRKPERCWAFARAWAGVQVQRSGVAGYPSRVIVGSHGRGVEIGGFLNEDEKERLALDLDDSLRRGSR
jgi:uncharacterized membrane protein